MLNPPTKPSRHRPRCHKSHESDLAEPYRLDRKALAERIAAAVDTDRTTLRSAARQIGLPFKQLVHLAHARRAMDWAYHAVSMWCAEVELRTRKRAQARRQAVFQRSLP